MTVKDANTLKSYFALGKVPVPANYNDLVDTLFAQGGGGGNHNHDDRYVRLSLPNNISAVHTFNPSTVGPPFILSGNAQGQTITGLKADQLNKSINAGSGLIGGGVLTSNITLSVGAGRLITVGSDTVGLSNGAVDYQFIGTSKTPWDPTYINISSLAGSGLNFYEGALLVGQGAGLTVSADAVALTTPGTLSYNSTNSSSGSHTHAITATSKPGAGSSLLKTDTSGYLELLKLYVNTITDEAGGGNLTLSPSGDITLNPTGNDVLPYSNYDINLGAINKKYLTLHAAELWVETLVAQNTIATIGGRILVGPTTVLTLDIGNTQSQLILNNGFNTAGAGGADVFANWTEFVGTGTIVQDTTVYYEGLASCKLTSGLGANTYVYQQFNVTEKLGYTFNFYTRSTNSVAGRYGVYDATHSTWIIPLTSTNVTITTWTRVFASFQIPDGCTVISIYFYCAASGSNTVNFDDSRLYLDSIQVKHNLMGPDDIAYLEANGFVEFIKIITDAQGSGPYTYYVERDYDGTGLNLWYAGDAVFNTGTTYDGFIDLYSIRGVKLPTQYGPTIVGNVRSSLVFNDWIEHWAIGNLNGLYGYGSNTYGAAFGKYADSESFLTIDAANGIRMRYRDSGGIETTRAQWDTSGNILIGQTGTSKDNIYISSDEIRLRVDTTTYINMTTAGVITVGLSSGPNTVIASTGIQFKNSSTVNLNITSAGVITVGLTLGPNTVISSSGIQFKNSAVTNLNISTGGVITIGAASSPQTVIDSTGMVFNTASGNPLMDIDASNEQIMVGLPQAMKLDDAGLRCLLTYGGSPNVGIIWDDSLTNTDAGIFRIRGGIIASGEYSADIELIGFAGDASSFNTMTIQAGAITGSTGVQPSIVLNADYTLANCSIKLNLLHERLNITPSEIVINEASYDHDFRVESNGNVNMLIVDGGLDAVGIGIAAVTGIHLSIGGALQCDGGIYIGSGKTTTEAGRYYAAHTETIAAGQSEDYCASIRLAPTYNGAYTVTRHNYISLINVALTGSAVVTDAAALSFPAAIGTHKAIDSGTTKTSPGTVTAWMKVNLNGVIHYVPCYASKTT